MVQHTQDLHGVEANAIYNDERRTRHDQFPSTAKTTAAAEIGVIGQVFNRFTHAPGHALRGGRFFPGDVLSGFSKVV